MNTTSAIALQRAIKAFLLDLHASGLTGRVKRSIIIEDEAAAKEGRYEAVCYLAYTECHLDMTDARIKAAAVILTARDRDLAGVWASVAYEASLPSSRECPPYIMEILSPTGDAQSILWRSCCAAKKWDYRVVLDRTATDAVALTVLLARGGREVQIHSEPVIPLVALSERLCEVHAAYSSAELPILVS